MHEMKRASELKQMSDIINNKNKLLNLILSHCELTANHGYYENSFYNFDIHKVSSFNEIKTELEYLGYKISNVYEDTVYKKVNFVINWN